MRIEDYALIGDTRTAALVGNDGSIDWLCMPRFDAGACFAALLGEPGHGRWRLGVAGGSRATARRYRPGTLVLETELTGDDGAVRIHDGMAMGDGGPTVVRVVEGLRGRVAMEMQLVIRFEYGAVVPWVVRRGDALLAIAGPDALVLRAGVATRGEGLTTVARFEVAAGQRIPFTLAWHRSHLAVPEAIDAEAALAEAERWWQAWSARCTYQGEWREPVLRSLITLKALTYRPTGGVVAAATTSLPEALGGVRNWDYRYCWLRDATFTLYALILGGYREEAEAWRDWLLRAVAGDPSQLQIMYGPAGERRLPELVLDWLPGYQRSAPVRIGNAAVGQRQLDVYGEVMDALHQARRVGSEPSLDAWALQAKLVSFLETIWDQPDEGIWEVRGPRRDFTHSKVMAWVALDRSVKGIERFGSPGPLERWRAARDAIHRQVCARGYDPVRRTFTQAYGSTELDASALMFPLVGFLPIDDERVRGTVAAIERELCKDGFVLRYATDAAEPAAGAVDGLPAGEGVFLACSFWLADNYALLGRADDARALFERLLAVRNDVGLLAEEYDPIARRLLGNFPQAFSHVGLINTAVNLGKGGGPATHRQQ